MPPRYRPRRIPVRSRTDALALLKADHERIAELFVRAARMTSNHAGRRQLLETACSELEVHAQLEYELLYPAIRHESACRRWLEECAVEHGTIEGLIEALRDTPPEEPRSAATAAVLAEWVRRHLAKEERRLFPRVSRAGLDLVGLAELLRDRRRDLLAQRSRPRLSQPPRRERGRGMGDGGYSGFAPF